MSLPKLKPLETGAIKVARMDYLLLKLKLQIPDTVVAHTTEVIGETLFVDGAPFTFCGKCGVPIVKIEGNRTRIGTHGTIRRDARYQRIMIGKWEEKDTEVWSDEIQAAIWQTVRTLKLWSAEACYPCFDLFDRLRVIHAQLDKLSPLPEDKTRLTYYESVECKGYRMKMDYLRKQRGEHNGSA
jgi:hypothetical protein